MLADSSVSKRARAFSATFFNRDRTASSNSSPGPASPIKPLGAESFPSNSTSHSTPPNDSPAPVARSTSRAGQPRPQSVINPFAMTNGAPGPVQDGDILPEMVGVFKYLGEHAQKVYHEGYFQKLNDMNPDGSAVNNREWTDCYAQLIGTVLTIWDDRAIQEEEERTRRGFPADASAVKPAFLNLTDASMKMIDSLPQKAGGPPLQNVLSLSTAGRNRYLLHFGTIPELTQWTAAIRLAMFEHNSLQEAYTGALIAAKGRSLNSIGTILERSKFKIEDWTRVRFGAGTPWKRYWTVITPPDEKAFQKAKKVAKKAAKQSGTQVQMEAIIGDIKFYENSKIKKKTVPVATITRAYAAYAVYPETKALIEQSTLIKIEGTIVIHSTPPFTSEGIIFMMPDHHAAVTGFEMMLRFLVPTYDVFNLYGRPNRLAADSIDPRSLMFAFPKDPRHQYRLLEASDIVAIINENGSGSWSESEWRRKLKQATSKVQLSGRNVQRNTLTSPSTASLPTQMKIGSTVSFESNTARNSFSQQRPGLPTIQSYGQDLESHSAPPQLARQTSHTRSMSEAQAQFYPPQNPYPPVQPQQAPPPPPMPGQAYGSPPNGYVSPQNTGFQSPPGPQGYANGYNSHPNSRPPSSKSQMSQRSGQYGGQSPPGQMGYRQPAPQPQQPQQMQQGGPPPSAYRGDHRGPGGFEPSLNSRQPPQLQTNNLAPSYPMPAPSPSSSRAPPVPVHSFSPVANTRAMSRLSVGTLEMMHGNNAGPIPDYQRQAQSPTLGFPTEGAVAQRTRSYGSSDTSTDSELSSDSDPMAPPRPAYTTQGHKVNGSTASITPATGAIASRIPKSNDLHRDPEDFDLSEELRKKQLEAAAAAAARNGGPHHAGYGQHPLPEQQGYGYANGQDGSAQSTITNPPQNHPQLHIITEIETGPSNTTEASNATVVDTRSPGTNGTPQPVAPPAAINSTQTSSSSPASADEVADRISHIDSAVFNRISIQRKPVGSGVGRNNSLMSRRSVYSVGEESVSDYSSVVQSPVEDRKFFAKGGGGGGGADDERRFGTKKFVGQPTEDMLEVVIGETKYAVTKVRGVKDDDERSSSRPNSGDWASSKALSRPGTSGGELGEAKKPAEPESTVVFLGHGRGMSVGGVEVDFGPTVDLGGRLGPKDKNARVKQVRNPARESADADAVGKRRSVAWSPGMVNFNLNSHSNDHHNNHHYNSEANKGKAPEPVEFDADTYVREQAAIAQREADMRSRILNHHSQPQPQQHRRTSSFASEKVLGYFNLGRKKSKSPSIVGEDASRPVHSRTSSLSGAQLLNRPPSSGDLLGSSNTPRSGSGSSSPNFLGSRPQSRTASKELASTPGGSRPQSQGNLLSRPASRGPSQMLSSSSSAALPLHSLPPPTVQAIPPSGYHPPQVTPTATIYHPPPQGSSDHYGQHTLQQRRGSYTQIGNGHPGKLSASEQEYIARTTGTPLLGQNWNNESSKLKKAPPHKTGLLGVMEKREKEKKDFKERGNRNSWTVQQAMRQRQSMGGLHQLQLQQQQQQQQQQQYGYTPMQTLGDMQQHYGYYSHQQNNQPTMMQQQDPIAIAAWNHQQLQQQQMAIMQQQIAMQQQMVQAQQQASRRGSWRYG